MKKSLDTKGKFNEAMELFGDKWSAIILYGMYMCKSVRFTECQRMQKINPRTLAARLAALEKVGLIEKKVYQEYPPRTEYSLTKKGRDLAPVFKHMLSWAEKYI